MLRGALPIALAIAWLAPAAALDLEGTWHVLVHYRDASALHPERERWDDRVWVFERKGGRMRWTEYPIVIFEDSTGRFETQGPRTSRVLQFWEPSPSQRSNIRRGVQVNTRGSKHKVLKQTEPGRFSSKRPRRTTSASVITYQEVWSVEGSPELPVFVRKEFLSGARSDSLEGITRYTTESASPNGDRIEGAYMRDETRRGSFRLTRSGVIRGLEKKTQEERQRQALVRFLESDEMRRVAQEVFRERVREVGVELSEQETERIIEESLQALVDGTPQAEVESLVRQRVLESAAGGSPP